MTAIFCPSCTRVGDPRVEAGGITICGNCGASLVVTLEDGQPVARPAHIRDVERLSDADVKTLRAARGELAPRSKGGT